MSYLNTYYSRINHMGETTAERIRSGGIRSFYKWMAESPHTVQNLSVERGLFFPGIILTNKDKEYQKIMFLNVANDVGLTVGDILNWPLENGETEKWLLMSEEKKVNGTYRTFSIIRCNYLLKWIDAQGHLQQSWAYVVSSLDSKIKGNYRTWNSLITPQPNKYAEILMPRRSINRATNFIIEQESWQVIEYDHTSVPGTIYLSLTENKINTIYDDLKNEIADTDRRAIYGIEIPQEKEYFKLHDEIKPHFTITKNGIPLENPKVELVSLDTTIAKYSKEKQYLEAVGYGDVTLQVNLPDRSDIEPLDLTITVSVSDDAQPEDYYIKGPDKIRLAATAVYSVMTFSDEIVTTAKFDLTPSKMIYKIVDNNNGTCSITANKNNILDEAYILKAIVNGHEYTKSIKIIPLW